MTEHDTDGDISLFLDRHFDRFSAPVPEERRKMADLVQQKSRGCFLWGQLIVKELVQVQTVAQAERVLKTTPSDMDDLYIRVLSDMAKAKFNHELVKSILTLAACCGRPLTVNELREAIEIDINDTVGDVARSIGDFCGNFVYLDKMKRLQLVHATV